MDKTLIMTVGLPRSGKSTYASKASKFFHAPIVNPDSVRLAIHGTDYIQQAEPYVWAITRTMVESLFIAGHNVVILDATNYSEKRRSEWKSPKWARQFKIIDTPKDVCLLRANDRLKPIIDRMILENITQSELGDGESYETI